MKDQSKKSSTSALNRKTGALEQLPSNQKRNLRTGQLANPLTQPLADQTQDENLRAFVEKAAQPAISEPAIKVDKPEKPALPEPIAVSPQTSESSSAKKTSVIEAANRTTNYLVEKSPEAAKPTFDPPKPVVVEQKPAVFEAVSVKPAPAVINNPSPKPPIQQTEEMKVREIKSIDTSEAKASANAQEAKADLEAREAKPIAATKPVDSPQAAVKPVRAAINITAATEAVDLREMNLHEPKKITSADDVPLFGSINNFSDVPPPPRTAFSVIKSVVLWSLPVILVIGAGLGVMLYVPALREKLRENLPVKLASMIGVKPNFGPQLSVQAEPIIYDEKEKTATLGGVITNISDNTIGPVQVEFTLSHREDVRKTETKVITIDPSQIAPKATAKYQFTISTKEFQDSKLSRILNGQVSVKFKNLGVVEPQPQPETTQPSSQATANPAASKPKPPDNSVYEGSVTFK